MEIKTSIVKNVQANGTHEDRFGLKYDFEIEMEDGNSGEYSSKSKDQDKFEVGKKVTYEWYDGKYPKIKPHYERGDKGAQGVRPQQNYDKVQIYIVRQSSIKAAIDFNNIIMGDHKPTIEDIMEDAEAFTRYVFGGLSKAEDSTSQERKEETDDTPF